MTYKHQNESCKNIVRKVKIYALRHMKKEKQFFGMVKKCMIELNKTNGGYHRFIVYNLYF